MKTSFKKLVAGASIIALVAMNALSVNAAALNGATAVVNAGVGVTVTSAGAFGGSTTCNATITRTNTDGTTTPVAVTSCTPNVNTNDLDIVAAGVIATEYYTITFTTNNNIFGSVAVGNTTNNVLVSATVVPTLSMSLSTPTLALGVLNTSTYSDQTVTVTTATNAVGGVDVTMGSTGLKDTTIDREIGTSIAAGITDTSDTNDYYKYAIGGAVGAGSSDMTASQVVLNGTNITDSNVATAVHVGAIIGATTEAGNYSDTLTFTVTGTF